MKKNILFICSNMGDGGLQRQRSILSRELSKQYKVSLVLFENIQLHKFHGEIIFINAPTSKNPFCLFINTIKRIFKLRKFFKSSEYDIILSSTLIPNLFSLFVKFLFRIKKPLIITINNANKSKTDDMGIFGKVVFLLNRRLSKYADLVVPVSSELGEELIQEGYKKEKIKPVYNGVDFDDIQIRSNEKIEDKFLNIFSDQYFKIVSAGRLTRQKNFSSLIKSFSEVRNNLKAKLIILGDGELKESLQEEINYLNLEKDVHLTGWINNPYKYFKASDLYVLSSLWEGFPNVILEAMACGLPVISTDCHSGPNEIITSGKDGILVPVNEIDILAEELLSLAKDKDLYNKIKKGGMKRIEDFDIKNTAMKWSSIFNEL